MSQNGAAPLSERQRAVLSEIVRYRQANGEACSISYLARRLGIDPSTVREHLEALHRKGWIRAPGQAPELSKRVLPPLPIPPRDEEAEPIKHETVPLPATNNILRGVTVERRTMPGQKAPSLLVVRTAKRSWTMKVLRAKGQVIGFVVDDTTAGG